jgi:hypothetical protein
MTDVTVYVAVISASAAVVGATIPLVGTAIESARQARRDRAERYESAKRQACVELVQAVEDLRTQVANNHDYHGDEMAARLGLVRTYAAAAKVQAVSISLLVPQQLAEPAQELAAAAGRVAEAAERNTDLVLGVSRERPDLTELDAWIAAFKTRAVNDEARTKKSAVARRTRPVAGASGADTRD